MEKTVDEEIAGLDFTPMELAVFGQNRVPKATHVVVSVLSRPAIPFLVGKGILRPPTGGKPCALTELGQRLAPALTELALAMRAQGTLAFDLSALTREQYKRLPGWVGKIVWYAGTATQTIDDSAKMGLMDKVEPTTGDRGAYRLTEFGASVAEAIRQEKEKERGR